MAKIWFEGAQVIISLLSLILVCCTPVLLYAKMMKETETEKKT